MSRERNQREHQLMSIMPYLQAKWELTAGEIRDDQLVSRMCDNIMRDTSRPHWARLQDVQAVHRNNECLIAEREILQSLVTDSSVVNANALTPLTKPQQRLWEKIDFTKPGTRMHIHERILVDLVVERAMESRLQRTRDLAMGGGRSSVSAS